MKKNILKKFILLLSLGFVVFGSSLIFAEEVPPLLDTIPPVITLTGSNPMSVVVGTVFVDPGATGTDNVDTTVEVTSTGTVDSNVIGDYVVTYDSKDTSGNIATSVIRTVNVIAAPVILVENIIIRNGDTILYDGIVPLPSAGTIDITDDTSKVHAVKTDSVLGLIYSLSQTEGSVFSFSDLKYYDGMGFMIRCITPKDGIALCDNWQYVVNGDSPWDSIDNKVLFGGEKIGVYFGSQNKFKLNSNNLNINDALIVTTEKYDYQNNNWLLRTGIKVGLTEENPNDLWNPIEIQVNQVDDNGQVTFTSIPEGTYNVGIKEDGYWPTEKLVVSKLAENIGGGGVSSQPLFSLINALNFLSSNQKSDGSFGFPMYTDWVAVAAVAGDSSILKSSLINYLKINTVNSDIATDNERRAMALMALGINPYNGTNVNYIKKIVDSFDGTQFGDINLVNDDIFALIVLKNAGYDGSDEKIAKDINYIISRQSRDGSWGSIDMTGAGIQALRGFESIAGVTDAILKGESYIISNQKSDGGFENSSSASWALQSLYSNINILKAENYLAIKQQTDGGLENIGDDMDTRVWATAYAIPAFLHKSWSSILNNFSKQIIDNASGPNEREEIKKEIEVPVLKKEEIKKEEITSVLDVKKIDKASIKKNETKKKIQVNSKLEIVDQNKNEGNPLSANVAGATKESKGFLSTVHNILNRIKALFAWLLVKFGF